MQQSPKHVWRGKLRLAATIVATVLIAPGSMAAPKPPGPVPAPAGFPATKPFPHPRPMPLAFIPACRVVLKNAAWQDDVWFCELKGADGKRLFALPGETCGCTIPIGNAKISQIGYVVWISRRSLTPIIAQ